MIEKEKGKDRCFISNTSYNRKSEKFESKPNFKLDSDASDHKANGKQYPQNVHKLHLPIEINIAKSNQNCIANYYVEIEDVSDKGVAVKINNLPFVPKLRADIQTNNNRAILTKERMY